LSLEIHKKPIIKQVCSLDSISFIDSHKENNFSIQASPLYSLPTNRSVDQFHQAIIAFSSSLQNSFGSKLTLSKIFLV
jgi:hypothetical protein